MGHVLFSGARRNGKARVWRSDCKGRYLLSGPAADLLGLDHYQWGDDGPEACNLAADLLAGAGVPDELAFHLAELFAADVLCALPDTWQLTATEVLSWAGAIPTWEPVVLPENW